MTAPQPRHEPRPSMHDVHARGGHKKVRSQKCPDCKTERDAQWQRRMIGPKGLPDDFDPYGKDAGKCTTGKDPVFRMTLDQGGLVAHVEALTPEEVEAGRLPRESKPAKRLRKGMGR